MQCVGSKQVNHYVCHVWRRVLIAPAPLPFGYVVASCAFAVAAIVATGDVAE